MPRTRYEFVEGAGKCLVLRQRSIGGIKKIPVEEVGAGDCKHDGDTSDCRRCWDCGMKLGDIYVDRLFEPVQRWL